MDSSLEPYFQFNKGLLLIMGRWPYQSKLQKKILPIYHLGMLASSVFFQGCKVFEEWTFNNWLHCLTPFLTQTGSALKLVTHVIKHQQIMAMFNSIQKDWKNLRFREEREMMINRLESARIVSILYALLLGLAAFSYTLLPIVPFFLDLIDPLNESRPIHQVFPVQYFVDDKKYFFHIFAHQELAVVTLYFSIMAFDVTYIFLAQYVCGMFAITGYRLDKLIGICSKEEDPTSLEIVDNDLVYQELGSCIEQHLKAIEFTSYFQEAHSSMLFILLGINLFNLSTTGVEIVANLDNLREIIRHAVVAVGELTHLFTLSLPGQRIMDESLAIQTELYSMEWYRLPLKAKKMQILMMMRSARPCTISAGSHFTMCLEKFSSVAQLAFSYFTVLASLQ